MIDNKASNYDKNLARKESEDVLIKTLVQQFIALYQLNKKIIT